MLSTGSAQTEAKSSDVSSSGKFKTEKEILSYWGIEPNKIAKEDGTEWKWTSFRVTSFFSLCKCIHYEIEAIHFCLQIR